MLKDYLYFGEIVSGYDVRVLNEREARAGAGLMLAMAIVAFFNAFLISNFYWIKMVVIIFLIEFFVRVVINPRFAPSLILGRMIVSNQKPEYVGAPQKRFAWGIGLFLAVVMFYLIVIMDSFSLINFIICMICLLFLWLETSFGICVGCKMYNLIYPNQAKHCPGGACEVIVKQDIQKVDKIQIAIIILFVLFVLGLHYSGALVCSGSELMCDVYRYLQVN